MGAFNIPEKGNVSVTEPEQNYRHGLKALSGANFELFGRRIELFLSDFAECELILTLKNKMEI